MELIDFDEWIELAGSHGFLRRLLVSQWQQQIATHLHSLRTVQARLLALITRFRQQQARARLVRGMAQFLRTHLTWQPSDYAHRSVLADLFNQATPLAPAAAPDLARDSDQELLAELLTRLPRRREPAEVAPMAGPVPLVATPEVALLQRAVKQAAEAFFLHVADQGGAAVSALAWWRAHGEPFDPGIWLLQVLAEYEGLPRAQRHLLGLQTHSEPAGPYNQLELVRDYRLQLRVSAPAPS